MSAEIVVAPKGETLPASRSDADAEVGGLLRLALEQGVGVEAIERLVALHERIADRNARMAFVEALAGFHGEVPEITPNRVAKIKTKAGGEWGYKFADIAQITRTVRPALSRHGLSFAFDSETTQTSVAVTCRLRHIDGHQESATFTAPVEISGITTKAQDHAKLVTYGKRQSLLQVLGMGIAMDDADGAPPRRKEATPENLSAAQRQEIEDLITDSGADLVAFLQYLGAGSVKAIPAADFVRARTLLQQKKAQREKEEAS